MSDLQPFPSVSTSDVFDRLSEVENFQTPIGDYLGSKLREGWWNSTLGQGQANVAIPNDDRMVDPTQGVHRGPPRMVRTDVPLLSEDDWKKSPYYRDGVPFDNRMTVARAQAKADAFDENAYRRYLIDRSPYGARSVLGFGAELLGGAPDPVNFIPLAGPVAKAAVVARMARFLGPTAGKVLGRAVVQGGEAAAGTAASEPYLIPSKRQFGDDTTFTQAAMDIAFSGLFGAAAGGAHGGWEAWRGHGAVDDMGGRQAAADLLSQAAGDLAAGRPVGLAPDAVAAADSLRGKVSNAEEMVWRPGEPWPADVIAAQSQSRAMQQTIAVSTPERDQLRASLTDRLYGEGAGAKNRQAVIVLGPPAAGKSTIADPLAAQYRALIVDSDAAKAQLPEFQGGLGAMAVHQESDQIAAGVLARAVRSGDNLVLPLVGKTLDNIRERIHLLKQAGYDVHLVLAEIPSEKAVNRAIKRFREEGRFVDPEYVRSVGDAPIRTYEALKSEADSYARYSNDVPRGSSPALVEKGSQRHDPDGGDGPGSNVPGSRRLDGSLPAEGPARSGGRSEAGGQTQTLARQSVAVTSAGRRVPVRYEVVDAASLVTSHNGELAVNPAFPAELQPRDRGRAASAAQIADISARLDPELLGRTAAAGDGAPIVGGDNIVESGNGRTLAIRRAYAEGLQTAAAYRAWLKDQGFAIDGMKEPILIRRRLGDLSLEDRAALAREANDRTTLAMGAAERAQSDARNLPNEIFDLWSGGDIGAAGNRDFVRSWLETVPAAERGALVDAQGRLSQDGVRRLQAALLARAYEDPHLIGGLLESTDDNMRTIGKALTDLAPDWVKLRVAAAIGDIIPEMDQTVALMQAVGMIRRARDTGAKLRDLADQMDMFDPRSAEVRAFLQLMYGENLSRAVGQEKLRIGLGRYVDQASMNLAGPRLFGEALSARDILATARGAEGKQLSTATAPDLPADPEVAAAAARIEQPAGGLEDLARELGIDSESGDFDEAAALKQIESRLRPDEVNAIRDADAAAAQADEYAAGLDAAAACVARAG